jgi:hypothetical protein
MLYRVVIIPGFNYLQVGKDCYRKILETNDYL